MSEVDLVVPDDASDLNNLAPIVEELIILSNKQKALEAEALSVKKKCDRIAALLHNAFIVGNCKNGHKFDNGVNLKPVLKETVFKAKGVTEEELFDYLDRNDLGHIIKPAVHWKTLSSVMIGEREIGRELDEDMFTVKTEQKIQFVGNGHIKFLEKTL